MGDDRSGNPMRPLVLLGAGGHARVVLAMVRAIGGRLLGVCDPALNSAGQASWEGLIVLGGDEALSQHGPDQVDLVLGVGQTARGTTRAELYAAWSKKGYCFPPIIHPTAWVASSVGLQDGVQIMAGAIIQPGCTLGRNVIVNTCASIDHDCQIGDGVHVAPGAVICGGVQIAAETFIGAGAVIIQGLSIGCASVIGAGVTLLHDSAAGSTVTSVYSMNDR